MMQNEAQQLHSFLSVALVKLRAHAGVARASPVPCKQVRFLDLYQGMQINIVENSNAATGKTDTEGQTTIKKKKTQMCSFGKYVP